jgi:hypothetical protein
MIGQYHRERIREKVAAEHGLELYKRYSERQAADAIGCDYSTLKRKRRAGLVPFVDMGGGSISYLGVHVADIIALGVKARLAELEGEPTNNGTDICQGTPRGTTALANGGSGSAQAQPATMPSATMPPSEATSAYRLAQTSLNPQKRN